jgi:hypothetical protein
LSFPPFTKRTSNLFVRFFALLCAKNLPQEKRTETPQVSNTYKDWRDIKENRKWGIEKQSGAEWDKNIRSIKWEN